MRSWVFVALLMLAACAPSAQVKVGVIGPLTGPTAFLGEFLREGVDMAAQDFNARSGLQVRLVYEDDKCIDNAAAASGLRRLHEVEQVRSIIGPFCGTPVQIAGAFSNESGAFIVSPGDNFGKMSSTMFNTRYLIGKEAQLLAGHAIGQGWTDVATLTYDNAWGQRYRDEVKEYVEQHGGKIVAAETYTFGDLDIRSQLTKIKGAAPDALIVIDGTRGELFQQIQQLDLGIPLLSEWEIETAGNVAGPALEGVTYFTPTISTTAFDTAFKDRYGKEPNVIHRDSYDAAMLAFLALEACPNRSPSCMAEYIRSKKEYAGAGGALTFDETTWSFDKPFSQKVVRDAQFVVVE